MISLEERFAHTERHTCFYLACGPEEGTPMIFVHGWPELSRSWRHQLQVFGGLGFRAVAPDMRGYGRSSVYAEKSAYALERSVEDMLALLDHLGRSTAIWVGHDWGSPVVWSIAQHHPERCIAVASLCAPYLPDGFALESLLPHVNRALYPADTHPLGQWEYFLLHRDQFDVGVAGLEGNVRNTVKLLFRSGDGASASVRSATSETLRRGGFFGSGRSAPDSVRDARVLTLEDEDAYTAALSASGFAGPNSWYVNDAANCAYAGRANNRVLDMPVLFLHAEHDANCDTTHSSLADPMRAHCSNYSEAVISSGHWMAQEAPIAVNVALTKWLARIALIGL
jgi:pimeloyl-ACP methyl ester carboxylesterase